MREMREMRERDCFARARSADIVPRKETDDERARARARGGGGERLDVGKSLVKRATRGVNAPRN